MGSNLVSLDRKPPDLKSGTVMSIALVNNSRLVFSQLTSPSKIVLPECIPFPQRFETAARDMETLSPGSNYFPVQVSFYRLSTSYER